MEKLSFRQNVNPTFRRQNNKNLHELTSLREEYERARKNLEVADSKLNREKDKLDNLLAVLEAAQNALAEAQEEIDADYLPEGAQPRARIQNRDEIQLVS
jgi:hypothetical protein